MELQRYITYYDVYKKDESAINCIFNIKFIYDKYTKDTVLRFLSHLTQKIARINSFEDINELQLWFGIEIKGFLIHNRAILLLYQLFFDKLNYNKTNDVATIDPNDVFLLFLFANQILSKTDYKRKGQVTEITSDVLMFGMKSYPGSITKYETRLMNSLFINLYKKLIETEKYPEYNKIIKKHLQFDINEFIEIFERFGSLQKFYKPYEIYNNFAVIDYDNINMIWNSRQPKIKIPYEYRFFEQFPFIKKENEYFPTSMIMMFISLMRKIYHTLSYDEETKKTFREFWGKYVVEPVIIKYIQEIFESNETKVITVDFQRELGVEPADVILINKEDLFLIEIKSGYLGLEHRYNDNINVFKTEFDKKYIYNSSGKHQLINQLSILDKYYEKISSICNLDRKIKYKIFSASFVYDEALSFWGFKRYLGQEFNKIINTEINKYINIIPFLYPNLITFCELISLKERMKSKKKRIHLYKQSFNYEDSLFDLFSDLKEGKFKIEGIKNSDFN